LDSRSVGLTGTGAAATRDGEESCGFKSVLSLVSVPKFESSCTSIQSRFYDAGETTRPRSEFGATASISTSAMAPISDPPPSANTACM